MKIFLQLEAVDFKWQYIIQLNEYRTGSLINYATSSTNERCSPAACGWQCILPHCNQTLVSKKKDTLSVLSEFKPLQFGSLCLSLPSSFLPVILKLRQFYFKIIEKLQGRQFAKLSSCSEKRMEEKRKKKLFCLGQCGSQQPHGGGGGQGGGEEGIPENQKNRLGSRPASGKRGEGGAGRESCTFLSQAQKHRQTQPNPVIHRN